MSIASVRRVGPIVLTYSLMVVAWELIVRWQGFTEVFFPKPSEVALDFVAMGPSLLWHAAVTTFESILGFLLGVGFGILVGLGLLRSAWVREVLYPGLVYFQAIPKIAIAPTLVIWFGFGYLYTGFEMILLVTFLISFFPVLVGTAIGLIDIEPEFLELMKVSRASDQYVFRMLRLPNAFPYLFSAFRVSMPLSVVGAVVAEFITSSQGLGWLILRTFEEVNLSVTFSAFILLGVISLALFYVIVYVEKRVIPWHLERKRVGISI